MSRSDHPVDVGTRSEAAIWARLVKHGHRVLVPLGVNQRYDLVVDDPSGFRRVQCKTGRLQAGVISFRTCSTRSNRKAVLARSYSGEVDLFAVYCPETDGVYVIPAGLAPARSMYLRVAATRNRQVKHIRWAKEFELPA